MEGEQNEPRHMVQRAHAGLAQALAAAVRAAVCQGNRHGVARFDLERNGSAAPAILDTLMQCLNDVLTLGLDAMRSLCKGGLPEHLEKHGVESPLQNTLDALELKLNDLRNSRAPTDEDMDEGTYLESSSARQSLTYALPQSPSLRQGLQQPTTGDAESDEDDKNGGAGGANEEDDGSQRGRGRLRVATRTDEEEDAAAEGRSRGGTGASDMDSSGGDGDEDEEDDEDE